METNGAESENVKPKETAENNNNGGGESENVKQKGVPIDGGKYVQYNILGNLFEVYANYTPPLQPVGRGAYGIVWLLSHLSHSSSSSAQFRFC